jgi:hypothetical protein
MKYHGSDCVRHSAPAMPVGACDCGADIDLVDELRQHCLDASGVLTDLTLSLLESSINEIARLRAELDLRKSQET